MATSELPATPAGNPSAAALHQLKELLERDAAFAQALGATASTEAAAKLAAEHLAGLNRGRGRTLPRPPQLLDSLSADRLW